MLWLPGMTITADRLNAGMLSGTETLDFSTGTTTVTAASSGFDQDYLRKSVDVTFPVGFFSGTPILSITARTSVPGVMIEVGYTDPSSTGFTLIGARFTTTATVCDWVAVEV
ncbi:hypothetical protein [Streptomyces phytophilus]|uniref:hypothetical protein n=1 Tax=Streptomyces phytophilus TaxID=722715 RepID=UPI0015F119AA|nr:hypothetical protein [Streptomyces phytophilus]